MLPAISNIARAQTYPTRPVRIVVPFPPDGSTDVAARIIGAANLGRINLSQCVNCRWRTAALGQNPPPVRRFVCLLSPGADMLCEWAKVRHSAWSSPPEAFGGTVKIQDW